jgi:hypothetical protein
MGAEGMRALVEQYTNVPALVQVQIAVRMIDPAYRWEEPVTFVSISGNFVHSRRDANQIQTNEIPAEVLIEGFSRIAKDGRSPFQTPAIERLGLYGLVASNAVPILLPMLSDRNPVVRQTAIRALGEIQSQAEVVVPALKNLLDDPDLGSRMAAASALRAFGYAVQVPSQGTRPIWPLAPGRTNEFE